MSVVIDLSNRGLQSLIGALPDPSKIEVLFLQRNAVTDFEGFGTHPCLTELHIQHNSIRTFTGMTRQRSLRVLNLEGNPIADHPNYRIMALLTIGSTLRVIDGNGVEPSEKERAMRLGKAAAIAVSCGWLLDGKDRTREEYIAISEQLRRHRMLAAHTLAGPTFPSKTPPPQQMSSDFSIASSSASAEAHGLMSESQTAASGAAKGTVPPPIPSVPPSHSLPGRFYPSTSPHTTLGRDVIPLLSGSLPPRSCNIPMHQTPNENTRTHMGSGLPPTSTTPSTDTAHVLTQLHAHIASLRQQLDDEKERSHSTMQALERLRHDFIAVTSATSEQGHRFPSGMSSESKLHSVLTMVDVQCLGRIDIGGGISVSTNAIFVVPISNRARGGGAHNNNNNNNNKGVEIEAQTAHISSALISIDADHMYFAHYFTRIRFGDIALREIEQVTAHPQTPGALFIRLRDATVFEIECEDLRMCRALHKLLHMRRGVDQAPPSHHELLTESAAPLRPTALVVPTCVERDEPTVEQQSLVTAQPLSLNVSITTGSLPHSPPKKKEGGGGNPVHGPVGGSDPFRKHLLEESTVPGAGTTRSQTQNGIETAGNPDIDMEETIIDPHINGSRQRLQRRYSSLVGPESSSLRPVNVEKSHEMSGSSPSSFRFQGKQTDRNIATSSETLRSEDTGIQTLESPSFASFQDMSQIRSNRNSESALHQIHSRSGSMRSLSSDTSSEFEFHDSSAERDVSTNHVHKDLPW